MLLLAVVVLLGAWLVEVLSVLRGWRRPRVLVDAQTFHLWLRAGALVIAAITAIVLGRRGGVILALTVVIVSLDSLHWHSETRSWAAAEPEGDPDSPAVTIAMAKVLFTNRRTVAAARRCLDPGAGLHGADVLTAVELTSSFVGELQAQGISGRYEHVIIDTGDDLGDGVGLWSRYPLHGVGLRSIGGMRAVDVVVHVDALTAVRVVVVHPLPPLDRERWRRWERAHRELADLAAEQPEMPVIITGDFNAARWHRVWRDLLGSAGLRPAHAVARRRKPSWGPVAGRFAVVRIDHALVGGPLTVDWVGDFTVPGSDHRGLTVGVRRARG